MECQKHTRANFSGACWILCEFKKRNFLNLNVTNSRLTKIITFKKVRINKFRIVKSPLYIISDVFPKYIFKMNYSLYVGLILLLKLFKKKTVAAVADKNDHFNRSLLHLCRLYPNENRLQLQYLFRVLKVYIAIARESYRWLYSIVHASIVGCVSERLYTVLALRLHRASCAWNHNHLT